MPLKYGPFAASAGIRNAARNSPPLAFGARGSAVAILQGALLDVGQKLPVSTAKANGPDGIFGKETRDAVHAFQGRKGLGLKQDGVAGKGTIEMLDQLLAAQVKVPVTPAAPAPAPLTAHYTLGAVDPPRGHDPGSGPWNSKPKTASHIALKVGIANILPQAYAIIGDDATKHMYHYLDNSGAPYTIDLEDMIADVPSARERFEAEAAQAQAFVELLDVGVHDITSRMMQGGYNRKDENWNWFFAIGGYSSWGKGKATVADGMFGHEFSLDFEYCFFDRYNWDKGKSVTIFDITITDEFMGEFHRQGLAREFDCVGSIRRKFTWRKGQPLSKDQLTNPLGGRA
jgi:peptidoglycan hydrolase-like protein with peptidoglycan-binding domain